MAASKAQPGDMVELRDKEGGFFDVETGFDIARSQKKNLGEKIGERTHLAIANGNLLIVVDAKPEPKSKKK